MLKKLITKWNIGSQVAINNNYLIQLLKQNYPSFSLDDSWIIDEYYQSIDIKRIPEIVNEWNKWLKDNKKFWMSNYYDCDDFAEDFRRLCVNKFNYYHPLIAIGKLYKGEEFLGYHAWNVLIVHKWGYPTEPLKFFLYEFEPQISELVIGHKSSDGFTYELIWVYA